MKIFEPNLDIRKSAYLNWRTDQDGIKNLMVLAEGYLSSAIELCASCLSDNQNKKADMLIFPILYNANHGIELYLKAIYWTMHRLLNRDGSIPKTHDIKQILQTVKARIREALGADSLKDFSLQMKELQEYVDELFQVSNSNFIIVADRFDFARYPITSKGENHFYIDESKNVAIDLENFLLIVRKIAQSLDDRASYYFYCLLKQDC